MSILNKTPLKHVDNVDAAKYTAALNNAAVLILDLEALYHNNFINGFDTLDTRIIKNCKRDISFALHSLNLYNLYLNHEDFKLIKKGESQVLTLASLPRAQLYFHPRSAQFTGEDQKTIDNDNKRVKSAIEIINSIIAKSECHDILSVRDRYTSNDDGFLIEITFEPHLDSQQFISKIDAFMAETQNLSLEEIMISQQFSEWYRLDYKKPFWLHLHNETKPQTISISIFNTKCFCPAYFVNTLLENIKFKVLSKIKNSNTSQSIKIREQYSSINGSYVNLNFDMESGAIDNE